MTTLTTQLTSIAERIRADYGWHVNRIAIYSTKQAAVVEMIPYGKGGIRVGRRDESIINVTMTVYTPPPHQYISLDRPVTEEEILQCAYMMGAYDLRRERRDGYVDPSANIIIDGEPNINVHHGDAQLYYAIIALPHVEYYFHPAILAAPDTRRWWWAKDRTLRRDGGRDGEPNLSITTHDHHVYTFTPLTNQSNFMGF